jgi:hypothetical protein
VIQNLELRPQTFLPTADKQRVPRNCSGCEWLRRDAGERRRLAAELSRLGEKRLAEIAEQSIEDLVRDWHAHIRRDPPGAALLCWQARNGRPSRAPQLTPAPLAITSPSSTARPGEKCWPASRRAPRTITSKGLPGFPAVFPEIRSPAGVTAPDKERSFSNLSQTCKRPMATIPGDAAGATEVKRAMEGATTHACACAGHRKLGARAEPDAGCS